MHSDEREQIRRGLDALKPYLSAFVSQRARSPARGKHMDTHALLKAILDEWDESFRTCMPFVARSYIHELRDIRNRWAHEVAFTPAETVRALDTMRQLAAVIGAPAEMGHDARETAAGPVARRPAARALPAVSHKSPSQRETMREIYARFKRDSERMIREYATAERQGKVRRKENKSGRSPEEYARALLADGLKKGWLA